MLMLGTRENGLIDVKTATAAAAAATAATAATTTTAAAAASTAAAAAATTATTTTTTTTEKMVQQRRWSSRVQAGLGTLYTSLSKRVPNFLFPCMFEPVTLTSSARFLTTTFCFRYTPFDSTRVDGARKGFNLLAIKMQGTNRSREGAEERACSCMCDLGSELRLGERKRRAMIINRMKKKRKKKRETYTSIIHTRENTALVTKAKHAWLLSSKHRGTYTGRGSRTARYRFGVRRGF